MGKKSRRRVLGLTEEERIAKAKKKNKHIPFTVKVPRPKLVSEKHVKVAPNKVVREGWFNPFGLDKIAEFIDERE
jgi:ribosomal protein L39E